MSNQIRLQLIDKRDGERAYTEHVASFPTIFAGVNQYEAMGYRVLIHVDAITDITEAGTNWQDVKRATPELPRDSVTRIIVETEIGSRERYLRLRALKENDHDKE